MVVYTVLPYSNIPGCFGPFVSLKVFSCLYTISCHVGA